MSESETVVIEGPDGPVELTPEEVEALKAEAEAAKAEVLARLDQLGQSLAAKRKDAIDYRRQSGIEQEWDEDDDAYEGVDELSKSERNITRQRPVGQIVPKIDGEVRSTIVLNITKPYVNAFASKIIDMRLQINDRAWSFRPTPLPQIEAMEKSGKQVMVNGETVPEKDLAKQIMARAVAAAERAQDQVDDWLVESCWDAEARQAIDDMARIGTGVLKGPIPEKCVYTMYRNGEAVQVTQIEPKSRRISARNLFPDPACGEDIHAGDYIWERDYLTEKRLRDLKGLPGYIPEQIDAVLEEGPRLPDAEYDPDKPLTPEQKSQPYQVWYYTGPLDKDDLNAAGCECEADQESLPAIITMVNQRVIRASLNPLDNGKFPYDVAPGSRREGHWAGIGIAREIRTPQRMVTGAVRRMMERAGLGLQIVIRQGVITPGDGSWAITPNKIWYAAKDSDIQQVQHAFMLVEIPSAQQEFMGIIQFALKMAEDVTGLPMILQGQQGKAPDILGVVQILNENATSVARRVAKMFDDNILEPHIGRYYDWLMQYGEDDEMKGDYTIDVMTPPDVQADKSAIMDMMKFAQNPDTKVDMAKFFAEIARANRLDPARIQYDDEEWKKLQQARAKQPPDPRVQVEQMRQADNERQREFDADQAALDRQRDLMLAAVEAELDREGRAGERSMFSDEQRVVLAKLAMQLRTQRELSLANMRARQISRPPTEPAGRATPGQAYQH